MVMDMAPLIVILTPILLPVVTAAGVDPVHFGVVLLLNLAIGLCTPPVGSTLFVGCAIGEISMERAARGLWPFYLAMVGDPAAGDPGAGDLAVAAALGRRLSARGRSCRAGRMGVR